MTSSDSRRLELQSLTDMSVHTIHRLELRVTRSGVAEAEVAYCKTFSSSRDVAQLAAALIGSAATEVVLVFHLSSSWPTIIRAVRRCRVRADRSITRCLRDAGKLLGMPLLDHVIVASDGPYYSFLDRAEL